MKRVLVGPLRRPAVLASEGLARAWPTHVGCAWIVMRLAARGGDARRTRQAARRVLDALARSPDALTAVLERGRRTAPALGALEQSRARDTLADLQERLAPHGFESFLVFGTLLGAVRDGAFIPGDFDIDLGVIGSDQLTAIHAALSGHALTLSPLWCADGQASEFKITHRSGMHIDVKAFERESDGCTAWNAHWSNIVLRKRFPRHFGLRAVPFQGLSALVPDCAESFLEWQYGPGWRTPDPGYHMTTSGPLHGADHRAFVETVGPAEILRPLGEGRLTKPLAMARSMAGLFPEDDLWPRLADALEKQLSARCPAGRDRVAPGLSG